MVELEKDEKKRNEYIEIIQNETKRINELVLAMLDLSKLESQNMTLDMEEVDLLEAKKQLVSQLSKGMKQRLIFARTIIHSPSLLFLDEPTANLDPSTANEVREIIKKLNAKGTTVFLTTHNMEEADEMVSSCSLFESWTYY